jgi:hypothetical protein
MIQAKSALFSLRSLKNLTINNIVNRKSELEGVKNDIKKTNFEKQAVFNELNRETRMSEAMNLKNKMIEDQLLVEAVNFVSTENIYRTQQQSLKESLVA